MSRLLEVEDLRVSFHSYAGEVKAVRGISFEVRPGEVFALLGVNGAGKTSALEVLVGLARPDGGSVVQWADGGAGTYAKLVLAPDRTLEGYIVLGLPRSAAGIGLLHDRGEPVPEEPGVLLCPDGPDAGAPQETPMTPGSTVCHCAGVTLGRITEAVGQGARALIDPAGFPQDDGGAYLAPQVLVDVDHSMRVMVEESFGPVVGIMRVSGDDQAVRLMNDSPYGLTASIWTRDDDAAASIGARIQTGTVFMNRADYLDPALCWSGCKDTGRGGSLSYLGYLSVTRPKSYHLKRA